MSDRRDERRRAKREKALLALRVRLADREYDLSKWGFGMTVTEKDRRERQIAQLKAEIKHEEIALGYRKLKPAPAVSGTPDTKKANEIEGDKG